MKAHLRAAMAAVVFLSLFAGISQQAWAERATEQEMRRVCENWLTYMVYQKGNWAGEPEPAIGDVQEIVADGVLLARCFSILPRGYVVVPVLKELPPVKACSETSNLNVNDEGGFALLLRQVLESRVRFFIETFGSLEASQRLMGEDVFGPEHRQEWDLYLTDPERFEAQLAEGTLAPMAEVGPLLTTSWNQGGPFNNLCPMGDGGRCVVGCVATAAAQIMRYHRCPNNGIGSHSYTWDGDQSCEGDVGGGTLSATFSDAYDWAHMPDSCDFGCTTVEQDALAELSYEVGVAFNMDYGKCGSGASTAYSTTVYPTYFGYSSIIDKEDRGDHSASEWFDIIKAQVNANLPMQYRIPGHSIVCDGWRDTGGTNQYHINYGWAGSHTGWFTIDTIHGSPNPTDDEYLIRNIIPGCTPNEPPIAICHNVTVDADGNCEANASIDNGSYDPEGGPVTLSQDPPGPYQLGTTAVTLTVEDDHGWLDECTANVTVEDNTPPAITYPGDITIECSDYCGTLYDDAQLTSFFAAFTATDNCDGDVYTFHDAPFCFPVGTTVVTFNAVDDDLNHTEGTADVTVVDTTPPAITCPGDITVECSDYCGTPADDPQLSAFFATFAATDICDDELDTIDDRPTCFPVGTTAVTYTATDFSGNSSSCAPQVTVADMTPPEITVTLNRYVLWPVNHKMADIVATVEVEDICDPSPTFVLTSISSNEPIDDGGDGTTEPDWEDADFGTPDVAFVLRSERSGGAVGRIYTIVYTASDFSGNTATAVVQVRVPHDQSGMAMASVGFNAEGTGFDRSQQRFAVVVPSRPGVYAIDEGGSSVLVERTFDATQLDLARVYVGNTLGALLPEQVLEMDNDDDGLMDLALFYSIAAVEPMVERVQQVQYGEVWIADPANPVGLHYVSAGGVDYLVPDIFGLGTPVELSPGGSAGVGQPRQVNATVLYPISPNPFRSSTVIRFNLVTQEHVTLNVYNARGMLVRSLEDGAFPAGMNQAVWDGRDASGKPTAAGIYFVRFTAGSVSTTEKMTLFR